MSTDGELTFLLCHYLRTRCSSGATTASGDSSRLLDATNALIAECERSEWFGRALEVSLASRALHCALSRRPFLC